MASPLPVARLANLIVDRVGDETIVYDSDSHKAHLLSPVADAVWRLCDGMTTPEQMADGLRRDAGAIDLATVEAALLELSEAHLIEATGPRLSRRSLAAGAALLPPMVASVLIPTPAAAKSAPPGLAKRPPLPPPKGGPRR